MMSDEKWLVKNDLDKGHEILLRKHGGFPNLLSLWTERLSMKEQDRCHRYCRLFGTKVCRAFYSSWHTRVAMWDYFI